MSINNLTKTRRPAPAAAYDEGYYGADKRSNSSTLPIPTSTGQRIRPTQQQTRQTSQAIPPRARATRPPQPERNTTAPVRRTTATQATHAQPQTRRQVPRHVEYPIVTDEPQPQELNREQRRWLTRLVVRVWRWYKRQHPAFILGSTVLSIVVAYVCANNVASYAYGESLSMEYGQSRIYTADAVLNLHDSKAHPSHIMVWDENNQVRILIEIAGDPSHTKIIPGPQLTKAKGPVLLKVNVEDLNYDGLEDLDIEAVSGELDWRFQPIQTEIKMFGDGKGDFTQNPPQATGK